MKETFQLILLCILTGFFFISSAQKIIQDNSNLDINVHTYIAPLIKGDDILNVYPQSSNYWTGSIDTSGGTEVSLVKANGNGVGWMVFDISGIVPGATIHSVSFHGYVYDNNWPYWSITPMGAVNPVPPNPPEIIQQILSNYKRSVAYSFNIESGTLPVGWLIRDLENSVTVDLQNALPQGWFAMGFTDFDLSTNYYIDFQGWAETNVPYLVVYCTYPPMSHDVGTLSVDVPTIIAPGNVLPIATFFSNSPTDETFDVTMTITPGGYSSTKTITNLPPGGTQQVTFDSWIPVLNTSYFVEACTQLATDPNPSNNCKSKNIYCQWLPNIFLDQEPNQLNGLFADETCAQCPTGQQTIADNFNYTGNFNGITEIVIWGGYFPEDIPNLTDQFTLILHADDGGQPGAVIETFTNLQATSRVQTGIVLFGTHEYMFTFDFNDPIYLPGPATYWIELFNNSTESGSFYWETGYLDTTNGIEGCAADSYIPATSWSPDPSDMSILIGNVDRIPVELVSLKAVTSGSNVNLNWTTATETNNQGFEVQRNSDGDFETLAFIEGYGTTAEIHNYSYTDKNVNAGYYTYRLKQVDFDGTFNYSDYVEVDVQNPATFSLQQNYPNPFNPSTKISYSLAIDSKVKLTIYNVLGETVATLVDAVFPVGNLEVTFDGTNLNSGIYFYRLEAVGVDGSNFIQVKKMVLTK